MSRDPEGFIYAIRCGDFVKIGWATNPRKRLAVIKSSSPYECEMIGIRPATLQDEQELHNILRPYRHVREWYRYEGVLLDVIKTLRLTPFARPLVTRPRMTPEQLANWNLLSEADRFAIAEARRRRQRLGDIA